MLFAGNAATELEKALMIKYGCNLSTFARMKSAPRLWHCNSSIHHYLRILCGASWVKMQYWSIKSLLYAVEGVGILLVRLLLCRFSR